MSGEGARVGTSPEKTNTCSVNSRFPDFPLLPDTEELNPAPVGPLPGFFLHMEDWLTSLNCYRDLVPYFGPSSVPNYPHKADIRVYLSSLQGFLQWSTDVCLYIPDAISSFLQSFQFVSQFQFKALIRVGEKRKADQRLLPIYFEADL